MRRLMELVMLGVLLAGVLATVSQCKNHYREEGKKELSEALGKGRVEILETTTNINNEVLNQRDERYTAIHKAGKEAAVAIATAIPPKEGENAREDAGKKGGEDEVDAGGFIPLLWSDALVVQHYRVCGGSPACSAAGANLQPQVTPQASR